ncbi:MAG TPA: DUF3307 domain-containing protein [Anaerolineae bacterium]|nr:DUF3307 domain-containing protein [Anaerolineae bacterium]HQK13049.1 DUF3307 domain-containing protein [Anaerolineae bacterium]
MFTIMILAHLLGDYLFQFDAVARWKARSIWGVVAHGGIVTLTTLTVTLVVAPGWWPNALWIGLSHTLIDVLRARLIHAKNTTWDLVFLLMDQALHIAIIALVVTLQPATPLNGRSDMPKLLAIAIGYLLLLQPAWVLLRFLVRGIWGAEAAPHLGVGEKYEPMIERVLIASFVLSGQIALIPLVLLPRRLTAVRIQDNGLGVLVQLTSHWAETLLSVLLAAGVGLVLRIVLLGK